MGESAEWTAITYFILLGKCSRVATDRYYRAVITVIQSMTNGERIVPPSPTNCSGTNEPLATLEKCRNLELGIENFDRKRKGKKGKMGRKKNEKNAEEKLVPADP